MNFINIQNQLSSNLCYDFLNIYFEKSRFFTHSFEENILLIHPTPLKHTHVGPPHNGKQLTNTTHINTYLYPLRCLI